jgi:hypothetical protein
MSLYPSIPIKLGVQYMRDRLIYLNTHNKYNKPLFTNTNEIDFLCELTLFVLENNFIEFGNAHFHQICGTAMGTPLAVVFANLFLQQLEYLAFKKLHYTEFPVLFKRYIDDILAFFKNIGDANKFIKVYNEIVDEINITSTISTVEGVFLDLVVYVGPRYLTQNKLDIKLYQKPQNKYLYLPQFSFHNSPVFKAFINAEINRILLNCSQNSDFLSNKELFKQRLLKRTYNSDFLAQLFEVPRSRDDYIQRIYNKQNTKNHNMKNNISTQKSRPLIFKSTYDQESLQFKVKQHLKLPLDITTDPTAHAIFSGRDPIICYKKSQSLGQKLSRTKYDHIISTITSPQV